MSSGERIEENSEEHLVDVDQLLALVRGHPAIYNLALKEHHNQDVLSKIWTDISKGLNVPGQIDSIEKNTLQIKIDTGNILEHLGQLQDRNISHTSDEISFDIDNIFPMRTLDDVYALEQKLADMDFTKKLTNYLLKIGGTSIEDHTKRILIKLFTNELALQFNWEGRGGKKKSLRELKIIELIGGVISKGPLKQFFSLKSFEKRVAEWFRQSVTRLYVKTKKLKSGSSV